MKLIKRFIVAIKKLKKKLNCLQKKLEIVDNIKENYETEFFPTPPPTDSSDNASL